VRLAIGDEENGLQNLPKPGEAPQHRRVGYKAILDEESSLDQSKGTRDAISTMWKAEAETDKEAAGIHAADARRLFWKTFPPPSSTSRHLESTNGECDLLITAIRAHVTYAMRLRPN
jgi:hypothetical protein